MKSAQYIRTGRQLRNVTTGVTEGFKNINQAKRASHAIQMQEDKALGRGTVRRAK